MKKKILLILLMFMFMTNVNALTFNVDITNIEEEGNNGTIGSIEKIDIPNKELDVLFQNIGDEVSFSITVTNTGDRAGTLRSIDITPGNDKIEYTTNLPDGGLAINGNDTNKVIVTAKVKEGAVNGKTSSEIKIKYTYDEGSCPDGEILSEDESMCLCPEGLERNENGICVKPEKKIECAEDEIYNETKKICEKKVIPTPDKEDDKPTPKPINPSNPKTLDNIILITLLFFVSGLGIYAVLFKKLNTNKKKVTVGVITGVITLSLSFTVLASVFGLDNLLSAIVNPITKSKELVVKVNEEIDLIETWDGECSLDVSELTPENIFQGGTGTESDPYQVKTAEQLSCFAKSINEGTTYEGQFIKQTKNIKLNDNLNDQATNGDLSNANLWLSAGIAFNAYEYDNSSNPHFSGTYDGDNHIISGLYLTNDSAPATTSDSNDNTCYSYVGMFSHTINATFKNIILSDVYMNSSRTTGSLIGFATKNLHLNNITTYGEGNFFDSDGAGIVSNYNGKNEGGLTIENTTNNINLNCTNGCSGIMHRFGGFASSPDEPNLIVRNTVNNGNLNETSGSGFGGVLGYGGAGNALFENVGNNGDFEFNNASSPGGISGYYYLGTKLVLRNVYNTGDWNNKWNGQSAGLFGNINGSGEVIADNCYNSGNFTHVDSHPEGLPGNPRGIMYNSPLFGYTDSNKLTITNSYNTGDASAPYAYFAGIVGYNNSTESLVENCHNDGNLTGASYTGGLVGFFNGTINKSYNKGTITNFGGSRAGGLVGWSANYIYNSYNEGNVINTSETGNQIAGICPQDCKEIKNSYNRGNVISYYSGMQLSGIQSLCASGGTIIENVYNSGDIIFMDQVKPSGRDRSNAEMAGIVQGTSFTITNVYNLGDIITYQNNPSSDNIKLSGIHNFGTSTNAVNTGTISAIIKEPYTKNKYLDLSGITYMGTAINGFNAGTFVIDDSLLDHSIYDEEFTVGNKIKKHQIIIGEISATGRDGHSNNKFNTDPNGKALGCYGFSDWTSCTQEKLELTGTYTTEETPDILSIINGDNAFNDELDEDGLPTLKAFNE